MTLRLTVILLGMAALGGLAVFVDANSLVRAAGFAASNPWGVAAALAAYTGAFVLRVGAWRALMPRGIAAVRLFNLILAALFLNHAAPGKAGDLGRVYGASRLGIPVSRAAAGVILARLADLCGLLVVMVGAWALAGGAEWGAVALPAIAVALVSLAVWIFARFGGRLARGRFTRWSARLSDALRATRPRALLEAFLWAAPAWILEAGILLLVVRGLGLELSVAAVVAATCFAVLVGSVPLMPGSVGTYEAGMVFALVALGAPASAALAAAVASHAIKFLYAFAAAPFALYEGVMVVGAQKGVSADEVRV